MRSWSAFGAMAALALGAGIGMAAWADEPKPTPENTISLHLAEPVAPQKLAGPPKFFISEMTDRSGNPEPRIVFKERGGVFLDRQPTEIAREAIEQSLKPAGLLAADAASADLVLRIYVFHFGLADSSGLDIFSKVEFAVTIKNPKTGESQQVQATGTSIAQGAFRKKNLQKNVQANLEEALRDAIKNLLRGTQLRDAVAALMKPQEAAAPSAAVHEEFPALLFG